MWFSYPVYKGVTSASNSTAGSTSSTLTTTAASGAVIATPAPGMNPPGLTTTLKPSSFTVPSGPSSGNAKAATPLKTEQSEIEMLMSAVNGANPMIAVGGNLMNQTGNLMDPTNPFNSGSSLAKLLQPGTNPTAAAGGPLNPSSFAIDPLEQSLASLEQNIKSDSVSDSNRAIMNSAQQQQQLMNELSAVGGAGMNLLSGKPDPGSMEMLHQQLSDMQQQQFMALNAAVAAGGQFDLMNAHQAAMMSAHLNSKGGHHNGNANGFNSMEAGHLNGMMSSGNMFDMQQQQQSQQQQQQQNQFQNPLMGHKQNQGMSSASNSGPTTPMTTTPLPSPLAMGQQQQQQVKKEEKFLLTPKPIEQLIMPQHHTAMQEMHMQQHQMNGDKKGGPGQPPNFVQAFNNKAGGGDLKNASGWSSLASNSPQNSNSNSMSSAAAVNPNGGGGGSVVSGQSVVPTSMAGGNAMGTNGGVNNVGNVGPNSNTSGTSGNSNGNNNSGHQMTNNSTPSATGASGNNGGTPTVAKPKSAMDSFQAFRTKAKEKMDRQKYLEQQEFKRMQKEAADKEKRLQEQQIGKRPDEVDSK